MVAQHLALRHPERVDRLVLACTSSGGEGGSSADLLALADLPPAERGARSLALLDTRNDTSTDPPTLAPGFEQLARWFSRPDAGDEAASRGARRQLEARDGHDTWADLPSLTSPTLVAAGRFDAQAPPANAEALATRIPGARLEFFEGGHLFLVQDPAAWPAVTAFLQG
jgi:3-oxoadipate enol-lactonase